jgi:hypothetical protein
MTQDCEMKCKAILKKKDEMINQVKNKELELIEAKNVFEEEQKKYVLIFLHNRPKQKQNCFNF